MKIYKLQLKKVKFVEAFVRTIDLKKNCDNLGFFTNKSKQFELNLMIQ